MNVFDWKPVIDTIKNNKLELGCHVKGHALVWFIALNLIKTILYCLVEIPLIIYEVLAML
jgi:hypothetical protein